MRAYAAAWVILLSLGISAMAADGWFLPNPRKLRVPYHGSRTQAHQVKKIVEAAAPGLQVLTDTRNGSMLFIGTPNQLAVLQNLLSKLNPENSEQED